jgi:hypothetical protein
MIPFDGNNSMKHMFQLGEHCNTSTEPFTDSDYLLPPEYVDQFKDEVVSSRGPSVSAGEDDEDDGMRTGKLSEEMVRASCMTNWKAASADERKWMWGIFMETGYFVSACHHALILWFSDMICSGEL